MAQTIRTSLLGFGLTGSVFHAPALASLAQYSLEAIVTSDPQRQAEAQAAYPGAAVISRQEWAAEGSHDGIDLVVVGTPPASHVPLATRAVEAGCAVVVDKPFALTSASGDVLIDLARARGVLLTSYQNRRWDGEYLTLKNLLANGALGDVHRFESRLERSQPTITKEWKANATVDEGGGLLFDLGTHLIDQALQLFGPVDGVYSELAARRPQELVDDDVFLALHHANGVISHLWLNANVAQKGPRLRVLGSEAAFVKADADVQEAQIRSGILPGSPGYGVDPEGAWGLLGRDGETVPVPTERGNFARFYELLAAAILDGAPVPVDAADSVAGLRIIEQARNMR